MVYEEWPSYSLYKITDYPGEGYICDFTVTWTPGTAGDFRDVRFSDADNGAKLPYWIASSTNFTSAVIKVRLGNSPNVYLHRGNGEAVSESNGQATFLLFDDFSAASPDTSIWTATKCGSASGVIENTAGTLHLAGQSSVISSANLVSIKTFDRPFIIEYYDKIDNLYYTDVSIGSGSLQATDDGGSSNWWHTTLGNGYGFNSQQGNASWVLCGCPAGSSRIDLLVSSNQVYPAINTYYPHSVIAGSSVLEFKRDTTSLGTFTDTTYMTGLKIHFHQGEYSNGNGGNRYVDWVRVRKLPAVEPTSVYVTSGAKLPHQMRALRIPQQLTGSAGSFIPLVRIRAIPGLEYYADSGVFIPSPKLSSTRIRGQTRPTAATTGPGMFCPIIQLGGTRNPLALSRSTGIFSDILESLCSLTHADWSREARISTRIYSKGERELAFSRNTGCFLSPPEEAGTRINDYFRSRISDLSIPAPLISVTRLHHLEHTADLEVPAPALKVEKWIGSSYVRLSDLEVSPVSASGSWGGTFGRNADMQVPAVNGLAERSYGKQREATAFIPTLYLSASPFASLEVTADCNIPILRVAAGRQVINFRQVSSEILPLNIDVCRNGDFHRNSDILVTIIETLGERQILTERITESFLSPISINASRLADLARESSSDITEPCIIAICAINYDHPTAPFDIGLEKNSYEITVTPLEFGLALSKNLFYAVIRDGQLPHD